MITWFIKYWKELAGAAVVIAIILVLWVAKERGYSACKTDDKATAAALLISSQQKGIDAVDAEMLAAQAANNQKLIITQDIGKSHATDDNAPPPAVLQSVIGDLYGK